MSDSSTCIQKFLFFFLIAISFVSCAQTSPSLNFSSGSVIFDYENESDLPSSRMAVFVDLDSDEHRAETIRIESRATGLIWESSSPLKFENSDRKYTGYTNFVMPDSEPFPQGQYKLIYTDASDESVENTFSISYLSELFGMNASEAVEFMNSRANTEYWVAYDENEILIFFMQKDSNIYSVEDVWRNCHNAFSARLVYMTSGTRTICIMPKIYKDSE